MKDIGKRIWPLGFLGILGLLGFRVFYTNNPSDLISFCSFFMFGFLIDKNRTIAYIGLTLGLIGMVFAMLGSKGIISF